MRVSAGISCALLTLAVASLAACSEPKEPPKPIEFALATPYPTVRTLAIAPVLNQSGSNDFDSLAVSDILYAEMQQVGGLNVLPLNKTLAAMRVLGIRVIDSPETAARITKYLGADGLVIAAITAYDPYKPPTIGMTIQLHAVNDLAVNPEPIARRMDGTAILAEPGEAATQKSEKAVTGPVSQVSAIFNAHNQTTLVELRDFAQGRTNYESALRDLRFLMDAEAYTRFVCHAMVRRLIEVERARVSGR